MKKSKVVRKGLNNSGDKAKQYFFLNFQYKEPTLVIKRLVLSKDDLTLTMKPVRKYKDYTLYFSAYGLQINTLLSAMEEMNIVRNENKWKEI